MGNSSVTENPCVKSIPKVDIKSTMDDESKEATVAALATTSSVGKNWQQNVKNILQTAANLEKLPGLFAKKQFKIYHWGNNDELFKHWSVVIGCEPYPCFFTLELYLNKENIYLETKIINKNNGLKYIKDNKWKYHGKTTETCIKNLIDYGFDLIKNHGKYSCLFNNCQDFTKIFINTLAYNGYFENIKIEKDSFQTKKIINNGDKKIKPIISNNETKRGQLKQNSMVSSAASVSIVGTVVGGMIGGPAGLAIGTVCGAYGGLFAGAAVAVLDTIVESAHVNKKRNNIKQNLEK